MTCGISSWRKVYDESLRSSLPAVGYYNRNYVIKGIGGTVILRVPVPYCDEMDLRIWPESQVMQRASLAGIRVPKVLHVSAEPAYEIHEFVPGVLLNDIAPRGNRLPSHVIPDLIETILHFQSVSRGELPPLPANWPKDGDTSAIASLLAGKTQTIYDANLPKFAEIYRALGVPREPLRLVRERIRHLSRRPFRALHCDLHRKNCIVRDGCTWVLDWELALWGDPLYELAVHLHKMAYIPKERAAFLAGIVDNLSDEVLSGLEFDLGILIAHEQCKSVLIDTIRYAGQLRDPATSEQLTGQLCVKLAEKLLWAQGVWQVAHPVSPDAVRDILQRFQ